MEKAVTLRDMSTFQLWIIAIALVVFGAVIGELTGEICNRIMVQSWNRTCCQQCFASTCVAMEAM